MGKKCQVNDNVSSSDQVSHNLVSSVSDTRTTIQNSRDADRSSVSSERVHSANHTFIRSDVSSGVEETLNKNGQNLSAGTAEDISQGDSALMVHPYPRKQLKADSSQLSSVDSIEPKPAHSLSNHGYSHPAQSVESKKVMQEPSYYTTRKTNCEFDLNEGMEANEANWHPISIHESNYSRCAVLSEPIPVAAKVGVPMGLPTKPLQFDGELGWKRSGITSAFHSTPLKSSNVKKANLSRGFDLNIAAKMDSESSVDEALVKGSPKFSERFQLNSQYGNENRHIPGTEGTLSIDLNHNPMTEDPQGKTQQLLRNFDSAGTVSYFGSKGSPNGSNYMRPPPYWVDLNSMRGYGHVQGQPFLLGAPPSTEQVQMLVPIQLPYTPPGLYFGNINNVAPTFYPRSVPSPLYNQPVHPGNVALLGNSQTLNPRGFGNTRQMILSNGSIPLMENNGSRADNSAEILIPLRNNLFEDRMKPVEHLAGPTSSIKRREPDTGWGSYQINSRSNTGHS